MKFASITRSSSCTRELPVLKTIFAILCFSALSISSAWGQALPTAARAGDLQLGGGFTIANSDYSPDHVKGLLVYGDFDFREHFGVEAEFHHVSGDQLYERTYEIGGRYVRHYGLLAPYAKVLVGRGVFNFPLPASAPAGSQNPNLAYNILAAGIGVDLAVRRTINARIEYEYQTWPGFPPNGLQPSMISIGAAYHFNK